MFYCQFEKPKSEPPGPPFSSVRVCADAQRFVGELVLAGVPRGAAKRKFGELAVGPMHGKLGVGFYRPSAIRGRSFSFFFFTLFPHLTVLWL